MGCKEVPGLALFERKATLFLSHWTYVRMHSTPVFWKASMFMRETSPKAECGQCVDSGTKSKKVRINNVLEDIVELVNQPILESTYLLEFFFIIDIIHFTFY